MNPVKAGITEKAEGYNYSTCEQYMNNKAIYENKLL